MSRLSQPTQALTMARISAVEQILIDPYQYDLDGDGRHLRPVDAVESIVLSGVDVATFLRWVNDYWRDLFEQDLQCLAQDGEGRRLLTSCLPLVTLQHDLCTRAAPREDATIAELLDRLRAGMRNWREHCVDTVSISGYEVSE